MTTTENLGLKKPGGSDKVLVGDLNDNADKLDEVIGKLSELDTTAKDSLVAAINAALLDTTESADAAAASAAAAAQSKTAAAGSATSAASSASTATAAKNDAAASKAAAETAKTGAETAKAAAESASASAAESKTAAAESAATATEKATAAASSAAAAASSATAAAQSAASAAESVTGAVKYNAEQTLTVTQKDQAQKNIGVTYPCNPNLLDNWYFGNPVNQRGQTSYSESYVFSIDRWRISAGTLDVGTATYTPDTAGNGDSKLYQTIEFVKQGSDPAVFSVLCDKGLFSVVSTDGAGGGATSITVPFGQIILWHTNANNTRICELRFDSATMQTTTLIAVKFELGSTQTLAHQDADGNWVLNEIPDYGEQLARCQRYFVSISTLIRCSGYNSNAGVSCYVHIPLPCTMRAAPSVSLVCNVVIRGTDGYCSEATYSSPFKFDSATGVVNSTRITPGGCNFYITKSDNAVWSNITPNTPIELSFEDIEKFWVSAEL